MLEPLIDFVGGPDVVLDMHNCCSAEVVCAMQIGLFERQTCWTGWTLGHKLVMLLLHATAKFNDTKKFGTLDRNTSHAGIDSCGLGMCCSGRWHTSWCPMSGLEWSWCVKDASEWLYMQDKLLLWVVSNENIDEDSPGDEPPHQICSYTLLFSLFLHFLYIANPPLCTSTPTRSHSRSHDNCTCSIRPILLIWWTYGLWFTCIYFYS